MLFSLLLSVTHGAETAQASPPTVQVNLPARSLSSWWEALTAFGDQRFADAAAPLLAHVQTPPYAPPVVALLSYLVKNDHLQLDKLPPDIQMLLQNGYICTWGRDLVQSFEDFWRYHLATEPQGKPAALANLKGNVTTIPLAHVLVGLCYPEGSSERAASFNEAFAAGDLWCTAHMLRSNSAIQGRVNRIKGLPLSLGMLERRLSTEQKGQTGEWPYNQMAIFYGHFGEKITRDPLELHVYRAFNGSPPYQASLAGSYQKVGETLAQRFAQLCLANPESTKEQRLACHSSLGCLALSRKNYALVSEHFWAVYVLAKDPSSSADLIRHLFDLLDLIQGGHYKQGNTALVIEEALRDNETALKKTTADYRENFYLTLTQVCFARPETHARLIAVLRRWNTCTAYDCLLEILRVNPSLEVAKEEAWRYYQRSGQSVTTKICYAAFLLRDDPVGAGVFLTKNIRQKDLSGVTGGIRFLYHYITAEAFAKVRDLARTKEHIAAAEKHLNEQEDLANLKNHCGALLQECGDIEAALTYYEAACKLTPNPTGTEIFYPYNLGNALGIKLRREMSKTDNIINEKLYSKALQRLRQAVDMGDLDALLEYSDLLFLKRPEKEQLESLWSEIQQKKWPENLQGQLNFIKARILYGREDPACFMLLFEAMRNDYPQAYTFLALLQEDQGSLKILLEHAAELGCPTAAFLLEKIKLNRDYLPPDIYHLFVDEPAKRKPVKQAETADPAPKERQKDEKKPRSHWHRLYSLGCSIDRSAEGARMTVTYVDPTGKRLTLVPHAPHGHNRHNGGAKRRAGVEAFIGEVRAAQKFPNYSTPEPASAAFYK